MSVWDHLTEARDPAVERIVQTVQEQSFAGLVGEADVGKSALLRAAVARLSDEFTIVMLDLDGAWSPNRLAWRWARRAHPRRDRHGRALPSGCAEPRNVAREHPQRAAAAARAARPRGGRPCGGARCRRAVSASPTCWTGRSRRPAGSPNRSRCYSSSTISRRRVQPGSAPPTSQSSSGGCAQAASTRRTCTSSSAREDRHRTSPPDPTQPTICDGRWLTLEPPSPEAFSDATAPT